MASTYTWNDALTVAKLFVKNIPTTTVDVTVCDQLNSWMWKSFFWRWSVTTLTSGSGALQLVDGTQDYGIGTTTGAGYYRLMRVRITRTDTTPWISREKDILGWLAPNLEQKGNLDTIQAVCFEPVSGGIRLDRAASIPSGTTYQIDGEYQFAPLKITSTTSTIVFPDQYFDVVIEGLKWRYYQLGDDSRTESQFAVFSGMLEDMKRNEDYGDGQDQRFPGDSIGAYRAGNTGLFGWY